MTIDTPAVAWAILAIASALVEILIPHFGVIFVSAAAVAAALVAWIGGGLAWQLLVFAIVLAASLMILRPRMMSKLDAPGVPSRTEALVGKRGLVTQDINVTVGTGRVIVEGQDWAARSPSVVPAGREVRVNGADGIVLEVTPV
jgi:membrane protein implicated in regulation of membrane protease activity